MKIRPVVYIVPLAILAVAIAVGSVLLLRMVVLLGVVGVAGLVWAWLGVRGIRAETGEIPAYCHAGDSFKEEIAITNEGALPKLMLKAEENATLPAYRNVSIINISGHQRQVMQTTVKCRRRGQYQLGSMTLTATDPFGLFSQKREFGKPSHIMVYPQVVDLPFFRSSFSSLIDFGHGATGRRISQISPSASSVREMMSGDSQEHIHWRSTAHAGKLMVKVFDSEHSSDTTKDVWMILDMQREAHCSDGDETTDDYCVTIAASLARKYLDDGMKVGLTASSKQAVSFHPESGNPHFVKMLESMALMKADGDASVEELMANPDSFSSNSTVVVITPKSTESVVNGLRHLKNYGNSVVGVFVDSSSFGGLLNPAHVANSVGAIGAQVYVVRKGDTLSKALDSRIALWYSRYL